MGCCTALKGFERDCGPNIGGIKRAWVACYDNVTAPTLNTANEMITSVGTPASEWKEYEFRLQTGSADTTFTADDTTGSSYYESTILLQFSRLETAKRIEFIALASSDTRLIIQDMNNNFWYFGYDNPIRMTEGTAVTGTARTDLNGYTLTFTDISTELPYEVTEEAMEAIINPTP
jgi:hypothetical protein